MGQTGVSRRLDTHGAEDTGDTPGHCREHHREFAHVTFVALHPLGEGQLRKFFCAGIVPDLDLGECTRPQPDGGRGDRSTGAARSGFVPHAKAPPAPESPVPQRVGRAKGEQVVDQPLGGLTIP